MPAVYLDNDTYRNAQVDLWASDHLARLNREVAPAPPETPPAAPDASPPVPPVAPPAASAGILSPAGAAPSPSAATPAPSPDVAAGVDKWARDKVVDAWAGTALRNVLGGVSQTLSAVPPEAQGWARNVLHLPAAPTPPSPTESAPAQPTGIPAPAPTAGQAATVTGGAPGAPSGYEGATRQAAQRYGLDPDIFVRQLNQESGLQPFNPDGSVKVSPAGARGIAQFMPDTARGMGINPDDPQQAIDGAARLMAGHLQKYGGDYPKALAAYNAGPGTVDQYGGVPPFEETQRYVANILGRNNQAVAPGAARMGGGGVVGGNLEQATVSLNRPSQFALGLSDADAYAVCGPAAAIAFARAFGRNPTADEAMQLARQSGWTQGGGMNGVVNEKRLMDALGVPTKLETGQVNWSKITGEVQNGNPVIVSTGGIPNTNISGHYFTVDDARTDPNGQTVYHVGTSGTDLRQGAEWMSATDMQRLMGVANGALYADHPQAQGPSLTESIGQAGGGAVQAAKGVSSALQVKAGDLLNAVQSIGQTTGGALTNVAQNGPIGATRGAVQGVVQAVSPFVSALGQNPLEAAQTYSQIEQKYGGGLQPKPGGGQVYRAPDYTNITPEDQAALSTASMAVGGVAGRVGGEGLAPKAAGGLPPNEYLPGGPQPGQLSFEGNVPYGGARPTGSEALAEGPQPGQLQFGSELPVGGPPPPGGGAGGGSGTGGPLPGQMRLPGFPNPQTATPLEIFNAYHSYNVISGPSTITHVALNSFISPAWSLATRATGDVLGGVLSAATGAPTGNLGRAIGRGSAVGSALVQFGENLASGWREFYANPQNIANRVDNPVLAGLFRAQQATGAALHSAFQSAAQAATAHMELAAQAGEQAWAEGARGQELLNRIGELMDAPPADLLARAQDVGTRAALRGSAGTIQQVMQNIASVPFIGNTLFPVVRIGAQSIAQGVEKSPLGLFGTAFDVARAARGAGPYAETFSPVGGAVTPLTDRLTNNLAGTALTAWMVQKALDGTVTGNGPSDPKARAMLTSQGWQPNSIYIPGRGYTDYHALGPLAIPLAIAGNVGDAILYSKAKPGESGGDQLKGAVLDLAQRIGGYMANATGMRTISDVYSVLHGDTNIAAQAAQFGGSLLGGFVPESAGLSGGVRAFDPFERKPEPGNMQQVIAEGLPGATPLIGGRTDVPVRLDALGRPVANPQAGLGTFMPRTGSGQPDPTLTLLANAGIDLAANAPKTLNYAGKQIQLSPDEQQARQGILGQRLQQVLGGYVNSTRFQALSPEQQYRALEPIVRAAGKYADDRVIASIPTADRKARAAAAPRAYGAGVVPYMAPAATTLTRMLANQGEQAAQTRHAALLQQLQQPAPQLAGVPQQ